ncbi:MAG: response regulator [Chloroflexi bacterium]|nr:response regulator [Chloroflexota bacterium]
MKSQDPASPVRILVVDDHPNTASTLARALSQLGEGVSVTSALSGAEALEHIKNGGVDILFTDMIMPEMTGLELIEKIQRRPAGKPSFTYLVTAYDVPGLKVTAHRLRVNEVIVKPVRPERICQIATNAIEEMKHSTRPIKKAPVVQKKFKILVADDNPDNITLLARYLEYEGYDHIIARDGLETLDRARDDLPDLVLLDVNMPHKNGFTVLKEIREDPAVRHIPVIILTAAKLDSADVQSGLNLGADDYVTKPFDRHELMARIRTKLRVKEAEDVIRRRNRELNLLPEIGRELSARTDTAELIAILLRRCVETLGAISGHIVFMNPDGEPLKRGYTRSEIDIEFPNLDGFLPEIVERNQGLVISDTQTEERWPAGLGNLLHSAVIVPLQGRRELLGMLVLTHEQENYFNLDHLLLLQAIASQAAIAVENARLYSNMEQEQKRLAAVLQHAAEAILMFDEHGRLILLNPAGEKLFTDFRVNINQPLPSGNGYDLLIDMLNDAHSSRGTKSGEILWPDQRTFMALITSIKDGGQVAILYDVTRFKDLDQVKNEFIATASHDLKNPLTTIAGFSALLAQSGLNEQQADFTQRIQGAAATMNELVQNMMSLAQMDLNATPKHYEVDMAGLLGEIADEFSPQAQMKEQAFLFTPLSAPAYVNGDPLQLRQLFRNLAGNAIKYTPPNGTINLNATTSDASIVIEVKDTGYGIPAADLPFIFNRFYRVSSGKNIEQEGNGLGLAIVKSIAEQHGGRVSVESEVDKGTRFTISLPLHLPLETTAVKMSAQPAKR